MKLPWNRFLTRTAPLSAEERATALPEQGLRARREPLIILGAGLAGCWLARLLAERGVAVNLIEQNPKAGDGASGNPAGIVKPHVTRSPCPAMDFHVLAHERLLHYLESLSGPISNASRISHLHAIGVLQLVDAPYPPAGCYSSLNAAQSREIAGVKLDSPALHFARSGWLDPGKLCLSLVEHPLINVDYGKRVSEAVLLGEPSAQPLWQIRLQGGSYRWSTRLVLACGDAIDSFEQTRMLPVVAARGQMSRFALRAGTPVPRCVINGRHYLIPDGDTVIVGATYDRGSRSNAVLAADHHRNLAGLRAMLPSARVHAQALSGRAGIRSTTPDRLPLAGPAPDMTAVNEVYADLKHGRAPQGYSDLPCHDGLYLLGGLGSRGIVTAPFMAELLANLLMGIHSGHTLETSTHDWTELLNPARFRLRDLRRGRTDRP